jgi:3-methyladenine DNA glycosylase AlkD
MPPAALTAAVLRRRLMAHADPSSVPILQRFFKTGPGEYGERDVFIGVRTPALRAVCRECAGAPVEAIRTLLRSRVHEERSLALMLLVLAFKSADDDGRRRIYEFYVAHTGFINNWDLVDSSAAQIVGGWLHGRSRAPLRALAASASIWDRRIAIIATANFIKRGEFADTFEIADMLLDDEHDLIHKAVGWMLREVGNRDGAAERRFLKDRYQRMPRTMLRYAIEKFPEPERKRYLAGTV